MEPTAAAPVDPTTRSTRADRQSVVLVKAATQGRTEFVRAWADIRAGERPDVVEVLLAQAALDNLVHGYSGSTLSTMPQDLGRQAARAAFQLAGSVVADTLWRPHVEVSAVRMTTVSP